MTIATAALHSLYAELAAELDELRAGGRSLAVLASACATLEEYLTDNGRRTAMYGRLHAHQYHLSAEEQAVLAGIKPLDAEENKVLAALTIVQQLNAWHSDTHADYVPLVLELGDGVAAWLQRQLG